MTLIDRAREFAIRAHGNQKRKYSGVPYWHHLRNVAAIVSSVSDNPAMIAAAWLHDVLEDTPTTANDLFEAFYGVVTGLVVELTDIVPRTAGNRSTRKAKERDRLAQISPDAQTIKLADIIDNARDIVDGDAKFARVYLREKTALLEVLVNGDKRLWNRADVVLVGAWAQLEGKI